LKILAWAKVLKKRKGNLFIGPIKAIKGAPVIEIKIAEERSIFAVARHLVRFFADLFEMLSEYFGKHFDCEVLTAGSPREAFELVEAGQPEGMLLDKYHN